MFCRMEPEKNLKKTKAMVCMPDLIWGNWGEQAYKRRETGEREKFRERKRRRLSCTGCGVTVVSSYLKHHMDGLHGI